MRRMAMALSVAAAVIFAVGLSAQAKKDFTGKWTVDTEKTTAANPAPAGGGGGGRGAGGRGGGGPMTIAQDAKTLTITRTTQNGDQKTVYNLDGTETTVQMGGRNGATEGKATAKWDGDKLVITVTGGQQPQVTKYYMDGDWLVSENATGRKTYYKKGM